jgi:uncharacterized protein (DUF2141 family)
MKKLVIFSITSFLIASCGLDESVNSNIKEFDLGEIYPVGEEPEANLKISFEKLDVEDGGSVCVSIVDREAEFPKIEEDQAVFVECVPVEVASESGISMSLKVGQYAAAVFHDKNDNGELDEKRIVFVKVPAEPFGFSNNPKIVMSAPDFDDCSFDVKDSIDNQISIKMKSI